MSNRHTFRTEIIITIAGIDHTWPATITYARYAGFAGDRTDPPDPAAVEIIDIKLGWWRDLIDLPAKIVNQFCANQELHMVLMQDWEDDEINAQGARAEARSEALAEDRRMGAA